RVVGTDRCGRMIAAAGKQQGQRQEEVGGAFHWDLRAVAAHVRQGSSRAARKRGLQGMDLAGDLPRQPSPAAHGVAGRARSRRMPRLRGYAPLCYTRNMPDFAAPVERLIDELKHLPGIGQKTAQRLAFHLLRVAPEDAMGLANAIRDAKEKIRECSIC